MLVESEIAQKAKERQLSTLKQNTETVSQKSDEREEISTKKEVAKAAGVSDKTVQRYKKILQDAPAEVVAQVDTVESKCVTGDFANALFSDLRFSLSRKLP